MKWKETFRLPDGETTTNQDLYLDRWAAIGNRLVEILSTEDAPVDTIGYDPSFLMTNGCNSFNLPTNIAMIIIRRIDGKLPWE